MLFLQEILNTELSDKVLVDINLDENKLLVLGRPPTSGGYRKQMRHVTPYSFIKLLMQSQLQTSARAEILLENLSNSLRMFLKDEKGICLSQEDYDKLKLSEDIYETRINTKKHGQQNTYYLCKQNHIQETQFDTMGFDNDKLAQATKDYVSKKDKFIAQAIEKLIDAITDDNTFNIACEAVARFIFTLFNQQTDIAFPEEGNSIMYEIRLYESENDAKIGNKNYAILSHEEVSTKIDQEEDITNKIRIVDNEGNRVANVIKALTLISDIINKHDSDLNYIEDLNNYKLCDTLLSLSHNLDEKSITLRENYNTSLHEHNILTQSKYHIAKHLYTVFDFKPLEPKVFVSALSSDLEQPQVKVFTSATGKNQTKYCIKMGDKYREDQRSSAVGYKKDIIFRHESTRDEQFEKQEQELLAKKVIQHLNISLTAFPIFSKGFLEKYKKLPFDILKSFIEIIACDYDISLEQFNNQIKKHKYWPEIQDEIHSSESEVEIELAGTLYTEISDQT